MINQADLHRQLEFVLTDTDFSFLGARYAGKVRENYSAGDRRYLITSDRLSCFDVVVTSIPFKGQVLNQLAAFWFNKTSSIIPNHIIDIPDPNVMVVRSCKVLPVEVVVRGHLAGSAWRDYTAGRAVSGIQLPPGLANFSKLPEPLLTPSTKAAHGDHDTPISEAEIVSSGLVDKNLWAQVHETALALFAAGQAEAARHGLILADTKYEFGTVDGKLILVDEIHTLDSSRYWIESSFSQRTAAGSSPEMLDKEPTRQWLLEKGFNGNGPIPEFTPEHRVQIAQHYTGSYERITGLPFAGEVGPVRERIEARLREYSR